MKKTIEENIIELLEYTIKKIEEGSIVDNIVLDSITEQKRRAPELFKGEFKQVGMKVSFDLHFKNKRDGTS